MADMSDCPGLPGPGAPGLGWKASKERSDVAKRNGTAVNAERPKAAKAVCLLFATRPVDVFSLKSFPV